ncbi:RNA polymerase sigma factor [Subtercola boreus]|uniref:RNA polymerase subunit sigma n=1 Tax=Subtercola boreus TaxID=120213 RepID=A0A3E0WHI0_9MICO|nr:RNA polymerase sigma factor [Subtercola boreus]RFA23547.1 RNA polymerase subunit sigma [Subtercola boreus]RFA23941.1 RNA polymerase subunit sigma [Subtercola boreus]RFA29806.1 RNA polymerase subunit sigma [Subtercola boreus]
MNTKQPFEKIVAAHGTTVLRVCRAVLGVHDADDAWSETFLSALKAYPELPPDANVEAWLVTIAHRKAIDVTRQRGRQPVAVGELPERVSVGSSALTGGAGDDSTDPHDRVALWQAVGALPDKQRQAVAYHYLGGLPFAEVAELLGGSVEAARRASSDGVKALRRVYSHEQSGGHPSSRTKGQKP